MLPAFAVRAGEVLAGVVIAGALLLAVVGAGVWWLKRRLRRRLTAAGWAVAGRARRAAAGRTGGRWLWSRPLPDRRWVAAARVRRRARDSVPAAAGQACRGGR
jgi:hypothetical protein